MTERRDQVLAELWPGSTQEHASNRLHHTLHLLRKSWQTLSDGCRPSVDLAGPVVKLHMPAGTCADVVLLQKLYAERDAGDAARLDQLKKLLTLYRGDLAADWDNSTTILERRNWLAGIYERAIAECVVLSADQDDQETAIYSSRLLLLRRSDDVDVLCSHLALLVDAGHTSTALGLAHESIRSAWFEDQHSKNRIAEILRTIHSRLSHDRPALAFATQAQHRLQETTTVSSGSNAASTSSHKYSRTNRVPTTEWLEVTVNALCNGFTPIVSLIGPPGVGKTTLADCVADRLRCEFRDGVIWLSPPHPSQIVEALAHELGQRFGQVAPTADAVSSQLLQTELLVVVDTNGGWETAHDLLNRFTTENPENRWLITACSALNAKGERRVMLDPSHLLLPIQDAGSPAVQMMKQWLDAMIEKPEDALWDVKLEQIATCLGGLPSLLQLATKRLATESIDTVRQGLALDPAYLIRPLDRSTSHRDEDDSAVQRLLSWLGRVPSNHRRALQFLGTFKLWMTLGDLRILLGHHSRLDVDGFVSWCVERHFLARRISHDGIQGYSEYQVAPYVRCLLATQEPDPSEDEVAERLRAWLAPFGTQEPGSENEWIAFGAQLTASGRDWGSALWLDHRIGELNRLMTHWRHTQQWQSMVVLCLKYGSQLVESAHPQYWLSWLNALEDSLARLPPATAADLLALRFATKFKLGMMPSAMSDARRCVSLEPTAGENGVQSKGPAIVQQYLARYQKKEGFMPSSAAETWEQTQYSLGLARDAAERAQYRRALHHCIQVQERCVLANLADGESYCLHWRSHISYCMGDVQRAQVLVNKAHELQTRSNGTHMRLTHGVITALIAIGKGDASGAVDRLSPMLEDPGHPSTMAKPMIDLKHVLAWGQYYAGRYSHASGLCDDITTLHAEHARIESLASAWLLTALTAAQLEQAGHGHQMTSAVQFALNECWVKLQAEPVIYDLQGWLIAALELFLVTRSEEGASAACHLLEGAVRCHGITIRPGLRDRLSGLLTAHQAHIVRHLHVAINKLLSTEPGGPPEESCSSDSRNCHLISNVILRGLSS